MEGLPTYISLIFIACAIATYGFAYYAPKLAAPQGRTANYVAAVLGVWLLITALLANDGFFLDFEFRPPRLMIFVFIIFLGGISLFFFKSCRRFFEKIPITTITYLHIIRVPIEIVLWWLFQEELVAKAMTFEGVNYDILSGITAPFAALFLVGQKRKNKIGAIIWNFLALGLLINIVSRAILATPYFFNPELFEQPNMAVFYFPFIWLPAFIVPIVFFAHAISLYKLFKEKPEEE